jgi:DHA1 family multidrug resistance protein-like MFS transporter
VRMIFLLAVAVFTGMSAIIFFLPIYASERFGMSTVAIGLMQTLASGTQLAVTPFLGRLSDRLSRRNLVGLGMATSAVLFPCYIMAATPLQMTLLTVGLAACLSTASLILAMLSTLVSRELSGMAMGIYGSFEDLGLIVGPMLYGLIWEVYSPSYIFIASAVSLLISLVLLARVKEK